MRDINRIMGKLESLGFSSWFKSRVDDEKMAVHEVARVVSVHKDSYIVTKGFGEVFAELSGRLSYTADSASDLPTTGDWVYVDFYDNTHAIIHGVVSRKTLLKRKTAGKLVDFQLIAANIDAAFIIQSVDYNFNLRRLERYLVMVNESGITPVILLSKCDLISQHELNEIKESVLNIAPQVTVFAFSNFNGDNIDDIKKYLSSGHTYCLLGSSGVGKTTLLNRIIGSELFETQSVSNKENKGRHTTTSRELLQLDNGSMLIDTPGMRELGNMSVDAGIDQTFSEVLDLSKSCKFSNCSHISEKGCAILAAISEGKLSKKRYKNYIKMKNESTFNEMSYIEKRKKDKDLGKLIKSTLKNKCR
ncbi:MAG: ribosome small subunit-dependent GTPase A [Arenicellales bacterium]